MRWEVVLHLATEHGFWFPPPCFLQNVDPEFAFVSAPCKLARSVCAMLDADATRHCTSGAAFLLAHFLAATAVLEAPHCFIVVGTVSACTAQRFAPGFHENTDEFTSGASFVTPSLSIVPL